MTALLPFLVAVIFTDYSARATFVPISAESYQLQRLVIVSEAQLKTARELLVNGQHDVASLDRANQLLERLSRDLERSIEPFQGTAALAQALLAVERDEGFARGVADGAPPPMPANGPASQKFVKFQNDSVSANLADLDVQDGLGRALRSAGPGFIPKLQMQAQLGSWQAGTRVSTQLTQLLGAIEGLRSELRAPARGGGLSTLLSGAAMQNQKQTESARHDHR